MKRDQADNTRVVIVGAGSAGLAAAHALRRTGIAVRILDKGARVAKTWRQRHPQLRLNTHRLLSGLPGLSMPAFGQVEDVLVVVVRLVFDCCRCATTFER